MRINARLDPQQAEKLRYLTSTTRLTTSDVIKRAIDLLYEKTRLEQPYAADRLAEAGFIGVAEGDEDLSERYKSLLTEDLSRKHGDR